MPMRTVRGALPSGQGFLDLVQGGAFRQRSTASTGAVSAAPAPPSSATPHSKDYGGVEGCHVKRPMTFDGESFASGLKGASHPVGGPLRLVGATKSSRSPLPDLSTMASCVVDRELATTI